MIWSRWSGAGNTFFIADAWNQAWDLSSAARAQQVRKICRAFPQASTDGLLYLEKNQNADFAWDFYNADGSGAEMCGNAARCAALYFQEKIQPKSALRFITKAGDIETRTLGPGLVQVLMPQLKVGEQNSAAAFFVNTGVPHWVLEENPDSERALMLRQTPSPAGANVTFVNKVGHQGCDAVTFERGVENFTQACGTGAVAAAAYLSQRFGVGPFEINMPGGILRVEDVKNHSRPLMTGPATKNFEFEWSEQ